jgi:hypothetical protein
MDPRVGLNVMEKRKNFYSYQKSKYDSSVIQLVVTEVIQIHENEHVRRIGQDEAKHREYKSLKLGGVQAYDPSSD